MEGLILYKAEIRRRLKKDDYTRLPRLLDITETFDNITSTNDLKNMLLIADTSGMKYLEFYQLKADTDITSLIEKLEAIPYHPNIPYVPGQGNISIAKISINDTNFEILANFYTLDEEWVTSENGRSKELHEIHQRRVLHIKFDSNNNKLVITIDPIGDGVKIAQDIQGFIGNIFSQYEINFYDYFDILSISDSIYSMNDDGLVRPHRLKTIDEHSNRSYDAVARNPQDNLSDESAFDDVRTNVLSLEKMRLSYIEYNLNIELFSNDLLKIWSKANWEQSDGIKENIIRFL